MIPLKLPSYSYSVKSSQGKAVIFDAVRRKFVALTPEEWVRQHWIHYLADHLGYSLMLMGVEVSFDVEGLKKRFDLAVFRRSGVPLVLVECKRPDVSLTQGEFDQLAVYHQAVKARYLVLSNGLKHYCLEYQNEQHKYVAVDALPPWKDLRDNTDC